MIESTAAVASFDLHPASGGGIAQAAASGSASVFDVANFQALYKQAATRAEATGPVAATSESSGFQSVLRTLESLNGRVEHLGGEALRASAEQKDLTPGETLMLTMRAHEFLFHAQLTANVANRTSEGVQQLFRQQG